jgi:hypothetical protein
MFELSYIVFRCINLIIVISAASYYAKKKMVPFVKNMMKEEQERIAQFDQIYDALKSTQNSISHQIADDTVTIQGLLEKLDLWREVYIRTTHENRNREQLYQDQMYKQMQLRAEKIAEEQLSNQVIMGALADARKDLEKKFTSQQEGKIFLVQLIRSLQEKS